MPFLFVTLLIVLLWSGKQLRCGLDFCRLGGEPRRFGKQEQERRRNRKNSNQDECKSVASELVRHHPGKNRSAHRADHHDH